MMVFFQTRLGKVYLGKTFLKRESPTLINLESDWHLAVSIVLLNNPFWANNFRQFFCELKKFSLVQNAPQSLKLKSLYSKPQITYNISNKHENSTYLRCCVLKILCVLLQWNISRRFASQFFLTQFFLKFFVNWEYFLNKITHS